MFKAKLIEDASFYQLRRKQLIFIILPSIPLGLLVNFFNFPIWAILIALLLYLLAMFLLIKNQKAMTAISEHRIIEMDEDQIRLRSKDKANDKTINLKEVDQIILKQDYSLPEETMKDVVQEIKGKPLKNFIIVEKDSQQQKFDFIIDSYYMLKQLEKLGENWLSKEFPIKRI